MTTQTSTSEPDISGEYDTRIDESQMVEYLHHNPDFFIRFPELLETLTIPHQSGEAISLVERQIEVLREKNTRLESQLNTLVNVAQENNETQKQLHQLSIEVLAKTRVDDALEILSQHLATELTVDHVEVRLFSDEQHPLPDVNDTYRIASKSAREALDEFTPSLEPFCGRPKPSQLKRLFGKKASAIESCAIIPLRRGLLHGVIALGSEDEHRFNPGMDTLYLKRLGELVSVGLFRLIE